MAKPYVVLIILALGSATDDTAPRCASGPVVDGVPVIYCPENLLSRPYFEVPTLRPLQPRLRKTYRPKRDVTE